MQPTNGLIVDAAGHLYGTTGQGGAHGVGVVFELAANATKTEWAETVLYSFGARGGANYADGNGPVGDLIMNTSGHLYGITFAGGAHELVDYPNVGGGTVFQSP